MPFTAANRNQSEVVVSQLTKSLQQYPFIRLVERSQMQNLMNGIQLSMTGLVNEQSALQQGKILEAVLAGDMAMKEKMKQRIAQWAHSLEGFIVVFGITWILLLVSGFVSGGTLFSFFFCLGLFLLA